MEPKEYRSSRTVLAHQLEEEETIVTLNGPEPAYPGQWVVNLGEGQGLEIVEDQDMRAEFDMGDDGKDMSKEESGSDYTMPGEVSSSDNNIDSTRDTGAPAGPQGKSADITNAAPGDDNSETESSGGKSTSKSKK